jgi:ABC-type protease/lipase transport system fused ATPase/permease subunit
MRGLLVERLRSFVFIAFGASFVLHLVVAGAAISVLQLLDRAWVLSGVVLFAAALAYAADRLRGDTLASAGRTFDRELMPAAIANSLDASRDIKLLRSFAGGSGMVALFDVPCLLLYLIAIAWIHPLLGVGALAGIALLTSCLAMSHTTRPKISCELPKRWSRWECRKPRLRPGASDTSTSLHAVRTATVHRHGSVRSHEQEA